MSTNLNPYSAPQAYIPPPTGISFEQAATAEYAEAAPRILEAMQRTRPWITMFSILSFIGGGLMGLGALFVFASAAGTSQVGAAFGGATVYLRRRLLPRHRQAALELPTGHRGLPREQRRPPPNASSGRRPANDRLYV